MQYQPAPNSPGKAQNNSDDDDDEDELDLYMANIEVINLIFLFIFVSSGFKKQSFEEICTKRFRKCWKEGTKRDKVSGS